MLFRLKQRNARPFNSYINQKYLEEHDFKNGKNLRVIARFDNYGGKYFLVWVPEDRNNSSLDLYETKNYEIVDNSRPDDWVELYWHRWKPFKKRQKGRDFAFRLTYYCGPLALLDDEDFLFDVIDNKEKAIEFLTSYETRS